MTGAFHTTYTPALLRAMPFEMAKAGHCSYLQTRIYGHGSLRSLYIHELLAGTRQIPRNLQCRHRFRGICLFLYYYSFHNFVFAFDLTAHPDTAAPRSLQSILQHLSIFCSKVLWFFHSQFLQVRCLTALFCSLFKKAVFLRFPDGHLHTLRSLLRKIAVYLPPHS